MTLMFCGVLLCVDLDLWSKMIRTDNTNLYIYAIKKIKK